MAWGLSGYFADKKELWDLWMMWSTTPEGYETLTTGDNISGKPTEYRVYHRIPKSEIWYVGSRLSARPAMVGE
jgi:hypothetical protein